MPIIREYLPIMLLIIPIIPPYPPIIPRFLTVGSALLT